MMLIFGEGVVFDVSLEWCKEMLYNVVLCGEQMKGYVVIIED